MANHDRYEMDILKSLQRIATSLDRIEKKMPDKPMTMNELREKFGLPRINDNCEGFQVMDTTDYAKENPEFVEKIANKLCENSVNNAKEV